MQELSGLSIASYTSMETILKTWKVFAYHLQMWMQIWYKKVFFNMSNTLLQKKVWQITWLVKDIWLYE